MVVVAQKDNTAAMLQLHSEAIYENNYKTFVNHLSFEPQNKQTSGPG